MAERRRPGAGGQAPRSARAGAEEGEEEERGGEEERGSGGAGGRLAMAGGGGACGLVGGREKGEKNPNPRLMIP